MQSSSFTFASPEARVSIGGIESRFRGGYERAQISALQSIRRVRHSGSLSASVRASKSGGSFDVLTHTMPLLAVASAATAGGSFAANRTDAGARCRVGSHSTNGPARPTMRSCSPCARAIRSSPPASSTRRIDQPQPARTRRPEYELFSRRRRDGMYEVRVPLTELNHIVVEPPRCSGIGIRTGTWQGRGQDRSTIR
jgi:hypothetical protein